MSYVLITVSSLKADSTMIFVFIAHIAIALPLNKADALEILIKALRRQSSAHFLWRICHRRSLSEGLGTGPS
jgi:hypothetical protein